MKIDLSRSQTGSADGNIVSIATLSGFDAMCRSERRPWHGPELHSFAAFTDQPTPGMAATGHQMTILRIVSRTVGIGLQPHASVESGYNKASLHEKCRITYIKLPRDCCAEADSTIRQRIILLLSCCRDNNPCQERSSYDFTSAIARTSL